MTEITEIEYTEGMYCLDTKGVFYTVMQGRIGDGTRYLFFESVYDGYRLSMQVKNTMRPFWVQKGDTVCTAKQIGDYNKYTIVKCIWSGTLGHTYIQLEYQMEKYRIGVYPQKLRLDIKDFNSSYILVA